MPVTRLNMVLLPEPFGPMTPRTSPSPTVIATFDKATSRRTAWTGQRSPAGRSYGLGGGFVPPQRYKTAGAKAPVDIAADATRHVHHRQNDDQAKNDELVLVVGAGPLGDESDQCRADHTSPDMA